MFACVKSLQLVAPRAAAPLQSALSSSFRRSFAQMLENNGDYVKQPDNPKMSLPAVHHDTSSMIYMDSGVCVRRSVRAMVPPSTIGHNQNGSPRPGDHAPLLLRGLWKPPFSYTRLWLEC